MKVGLLAAMGALGGCAAPPSAAPVELASAELRGAPTASAAPLPSVRPELVGRAELIPLHPEPTATQRPRPTHPCPSSIPEERSDCAPPPGPVSCDYGGAPANTVCTCRDLEWTWSCTLHSWK
ncbi:MAG: hypothetical protein U0414_36370 [Polyangiaceae bacterium]